MARARNIKPGFFKNEDLAECSAFARLCFAGLWTLADREGRLEDRPKRIKGELFAYDSVEVEPLLQELAKWKFILRYVVDGVAVIQILEFKKHQTPHFKELPSELPPHESLGLDAHSMDGKPKTSPPLNDHETQGETEFGPGLDHDSKGGQSPLNPESGFLIPDSLNPRTHPSAGSAALQSLPGFDRFWAAWPKSTRKEARGKCFDAWRKANAERIADAVIAHVERKKQTEDWTKANGQFIEAPLVYLNNRRWEGAEDLIDTDQRSFV